MVNFCWFQLLKCENLRFFFVIYDSSLNIFGFWIVGHIKQTILLFIVFIDASSFFAIHFAAVTLEIPPLWD